MSANVVFIVLTSAIKSRIVCDLAEKCYLDGKRLIIYSDNKETAKNLDQLLWTWKQQSFIPHNYIDSLTGNQPEPVVLTSEIGTTGDYDSIILHDPLPLDQLKSFSLIIEFAEKYDESSIRKSRARYKSYHAKDYHIVSQPPGEYLHT